MNGHPTNEDRQALIAGDDAGALEPDERSELPLLADLLGDPSTWAEPRAGLEDMIVQAVERAAPAPAADEPPASTAISARRKSMTRRRRLTLSAVSAAAAIATVVGTVAVVGSSSPADFTSRLSATAVAPAARASADFTKNKAGFRITLDARGLPKLPAGEYYQAWLKNRAGILVPIGTFSSSDGKVTLWSGVSPKEFGTISVTIEATDGDQRTSDRKVLVGMVHAH
jgi:hypothetical protein